MSKSALAFAALTLAAIVVTCLLPVQAQTFSALPKIAAGIFLTLFVAALIVGRRYKFDPVLR